MEGYLPTGWFEAKIGNFQFRQDRDGVSARHLGASIGKTTAFDLLVAQAEDIGLRQGLGRNTYAGSRK